MLSIFEYNVLISISVNISTSKTTKAIWTNFIQDILSLFKIALILLFSFLISFTAHQVFKLIGFISNGEFLNMVLSFVK